MAKKKTGGGGKLNRSQTVTLRLDPKLRYLTDLAARTQRRTTSGFIEWAIENSLSNVSIADSSGTVALSEIGDYLWDVDESDRFLKLATGYPSLLTHEEQIIWKVVREDMLIPPINSYEDFHKDHKKRVNDHWDELKAIASGKADKSALFKKLIPF